MWSSGCGGWTDTCYENRDWAERQMGTLGKYARHDVYYKIEAIHGSCRVKNGSLGAMWTACVLQLYSGGPNGAGFAVVRAMELGATVLRTDVSRIIVSGAVLLVAFMVVSGVSIVIRSGAVMLGDIVLASVVSRVAVVRVVVLGVRC